MSAAGEFTWKLLGISSGLMAAKLSRSVAEKIWVKTKGGNPPRNPASWETTWGEALSWAVATGVAAGVARMLASRGAAHAWEKTTGHLPPGLEEVGA